jgi:hypothetical protein
MLDDCRRLTGILCAYSVSSTANGEEELSTAELRHSGYPVRDPDIRAVQDPVAARPRTACAAAIDASKAIASRCRRPLPGAAERQRCPAESTKWRLVVAKVSRYVAAMVPCRNRATVGIDAPSTLGEPDVAIVGGGIVGLGTANALMREHPRLKAVVVERERRCRRAPNGTQRRCHPRRHLLRPGIAEDRTMRERSATNLRLPRSPRDRRPALRKADRRSPPNRAGAARGDRGPRPG